MDKTLSSGRAEGKAAATVAAIAQAMIDGEAAVMLVPNGLAEDLRVALPSDTFDDEPAKMEGFTIFRRMGAVT